MLTLLGSLLGFLSSGLPKVFDFFEKKEDNKLRMEMLKAQLEATKEGKLMDLEIFHAKKEFSEHEMLLKHDIATQNNKLSSSVRPVITYLFFALFATVKGSMIYYSWLNGVDFHTIMQTVWDEETQAIFAAIISFWFGSRALYRNQMNKK